MGEITTLSDTLKLLPGDVPILLDNETCVYCGTSLIVQNDTKEHVIGRRFVPKGKLDGQWNLIVRACSSCNRKKADLEDDISAITMQTDASGKHAIEDEALKQEARRKAANCFSRRTGKTICDSSEKIKLEMPLGPGATITFNLSSPPQVREERVYELARMQIAGFFYWITYDHATKKGGFWLGSFFALLQSPRSDWGNPVYIHFMRSVIDWEPRVLAIGADSFFKIAIRRHPDAVCWSWALEWNQNYRVIGFFGEEEPIRAILADFPVLTTNTIAQGPNEFVSFRTETSLKESDDYLFE